MTGLDTRNEGPMARLERVQADPEAPSVIAQRIADGEDLRELAKAWGLPRGRFIEWFTESYPEKYAAARKALGHALVHAVQKMVDDATVETAALVKLRTDRYLRVASLLNPETYGQRVQHQHTHTVDLGERLRRARERVIEQVVGDAPAPLPALAPALAANTAGASFSASGGVTSRAEMPSAAPAVDASAEFPRPPRHQHVEEVVI